MLPELIERGPFGRPISLPQRRDRLHVMPTSTGYEIAEGPGYDWDGRRRGSVPFSVLQYCIAGEGRLQYERHSYRVRPGETMLVVIPHAHRYWVDEGGHVRIDYRPVHAYTMSNDVEYIKPKARVY